MKITLIPPHYTANMVMLRLTVEQYRKLPILVDEKTCVGKIYIITGGNSGLGLETAPMEMNQAEASA